MGCDQLPKRAHGKEGVDGSSPSEGSAKVPQDGTFAFRTNLHETKRAASVAMTEHAVLIAGGGPTGLMLAGELALAGVEVAIIERRTSQELAGSRAGGLHSRTIEIKRTSPDSLLDTYHDERYPVAARVLRDTIAQVSLFKPDERVKTLGDTITELLAMDEPRRRFAARMSGLDIHYDLGEGHPLLGRRMPDLDLSPPTAQCGCSPCCTTPGRCSSTSVSPEPSTSHHGRIGSC